MWKAIEDLQKFSDMTDTTGETGQAWLLLLTSMYTIIDRFKIVNSKLMRNRRSTKKQIWLTP